MIYNNFYKWITFIELHHEFKILNVRNSVNGSDFVPDCGNGNRDGKCLCNNGWIVLIVMLHYLKVVVHLLILQSHMVIYFISIQLKFKFIFQASNYEVPNPINNLDGYILVDANVSCFFNLLGIVAKRLLLSLLKVITALHHLYCIPEGATITLSVTTIYGMVYDQTDFNQLQSSTSCYLVHFSTNQNSFATFSMCGPNSNI
ncbi:hypothetical protein ACTA71_000805 [Dictyostelium dimigraforme]